MNQSEFEKSRLERLKQELEGSPEGALPKPMGGTLSPHDVSVSGNWTPQATFPEQKKHYLNVSVFKFFLGCLIVLFVAVIGFFIYKIFDDPDMRPSDKNVALRIDGPVSVAAGEPIEFSVVVANKNRIPLAYANLIITYPDGTQSPIDLTKPLREEKKILGEVLAGQEATHRARAIFLGEEKVEKRVIVTLEYRLDGVNSALTKSQEYIVNLSASPINVVVDTLREMNSGQEIELKISLTANTREILNDVLLKADYPFGFTFKEASQKPAFQNNVWKIGNIAPGTKQTFTIRGTLSGEDGQEKVFRVYVGTQGRQEYAIETVYGSLLSSVTIKRPFIAVDLFIGQEHKDIYISDFGKVITGVITWKNNLSTRITNAEVEVKVKGSSLDRRSIQPQEGGFYRSSDDTIIWDERQTPALTLIDTGRGGEVSFTFAPLPATYQGTLFRNPEIILEVTIRGKRVSETGVPESIDAVVTKRVHLNTELKFAGRSVYYQSPTTFKNTGPVPPRVGQETTYTILWSLVNTSNTVNDVVVTSRLPSYIKWQEEVDPQAEDIRYDDTRGIVTWNVGEVAAGTGIVGPAKQVAFQVSLIPSLGQVNQVPDLLFESVVTGIDSFTETPIQKKQGKLNAALSTDPLAPQNAGVVRE